MSWQRLVNIAEDLESVTQKLFIHAKRVFSYLQKGRIVFELKVLLKVRLENVPLNCLDPRLGQLEEVFDESHIHSNQLLTVHLIRLPVHCLDKSFDQRQLVWVLNHP